MKFEECTIQQFINAKFLGIDSLITKEEIESIWEAYIDKTKQYEVEEFEMVSYIHYLNGRINYIKMSVDLQKRFIDNFDLPYLEAIKSFQKKYGYFLKYNGDNEDFKRQLDNIEKKEGKYIVELEEKIKALLEFRKSKRSKDNPVKVTKESFLMTVIILSKIGYSIDKNSTTMEELALMIENQNEQNEKRRNK